MVQFAFAHVGLGVRSTDHVPIVDESAPSNGRVQAIWSEFAAGQARLAAVHRYNLYGFPLCTVYGEKGQVRLVLWTLRSASYKKYKPNNFVPSTVILH